MSLLDDIERAQVLAGEQAVMRHLKKIGFVNPEPEPETKRSLGLKCQHCRLEALVVLADRVMVELEKLRSGLVNDIGSAVTAYAEARIQVKLEEVP